MNINFIYIDITCEIMDIMCMECTSMSVKEWFSFVYKVSLIEVCQVKPVSYFIWVIIKVNVESHYWCTKCIDLNEC